MLTNEVFIAAVKRKIETRLDWGDSLEWTNQDFISLSEKIAEETRASLSHVTLKRVWGKLKYNSQPNAYTLNVLAQFAGYTNWRDFVSKTKCNTTSAATLTEQAVTPETSTHKKSRFLKPVLVIAVLASVSVFVVVFAWRKDKKNDSVAYSFSSKKVITEGVPNTVIFDYDATKAPTDSVVIQQSWDRKRRTTVSKNQRQHTSIYYLPDYYEAKLIVNNKIVKQHNLLIKSDGWLTAVLLSPVPVYIPKKEVIHEGRMSLTMEGIKARNIPVLPNAPNIIFSNVQDFGPVYTDDFVFETELKNDYKGGSSVCQKTIIYLLCEGTAIGIPLCSKGCVSDADLLFTSFSLSGKQKDLSAFGVDFSRFIKVRVVSQNGKANIFLNDKLAYVVDKNIRKAKIIGFDFVFEGTGTVNYVRLSNDRVVFEDDFVK